MLYLWDYLWNLSSVVKWEFTEEVELVKPFLIYLEGPIRVTISQFQLDVPFHTFVEHTLCRIPLPIHKVYRHVTFDD